MIRNFPSKRVFVVAFVAIGFLVWTIWSVNSLSNREAQLAKSPLEVSSSQDLSMVPDSDNDKLPDWKEVLFGTNSYDKDSDSNGVSDGNQYVSEKNIRLIKASDSPINYLTSLGNSLTNQQSGDFVNLPNAELRQFPDHYTRDGVSIVKTTVDTATVYVNGVLETVSLNSKIIEEEALIIIQNWVETNDERALKQLEDLKIALEKTSSQIAKLDVPIKFVDTHLNLVNSLYLEAQALNDIEVTTINPVQGFLASAQYANYRSKRSQAIVDLTDYYFGIVPPPNNQIN